MDIPNNCVNEYITEIKINRNTLHNQKFIMYPFPYVKDIFWTKYKVSSDLNIELMLLTTDCYKYIINNSNDISKDQWNIIKWMIPSINCINGSGLYFIITEISNDTSELLSNINEYQPSDITIQLLGYRNIVPDSEVYILSWENDIFQFIFSNDKEHNIGTVCNVEHNDYISTDINRAHIIYPNYNRT